MSNEERSGRRKNTWPQVMGGERTFTLMKEEDGNEDAERGKERRRLQGRRVKGGKIEKKEKIFPLRIN